MSAVISNRMYVHVLLDRSGSMESCASDAVGGYNTYVSGLPEDAVVSLTIFDSRTIEKIRNQVAPREARITRREFQPRAGTPLLDAVGKTAASIVELATGFDRIVYVILTDGEENESKEWTPAAVKTLLRNKQDIDHWLIIFLGANQDAWKTADGMGIHRRTSMTYSTGKMAETFAAAARSTTDYAKEEEVEKALQISAFTDSERKDVI